MLPLQDRAKTNLLCCTVPRLFTTWPMFAAPGRKRNKRINKGDKTKEIGRPKVGTLLATASRSGDTTGVRVEISFLNDPVSVANPGGRLPFTRIGLTQAASAG
jgi:hypothetical protein